MIPTEPFEVRLSRILDAYAPRPEADADIPGLSKEFNQLLDAYQRQPPVKLHRKSLASKKPEKIVRPESESQLSDLIQTAAGTGMSIRVIGTGSSNSFDSIYSSPEDSNVTLVSLSHSAFCTVAIDDAKQTVTAGAGCMIGDIDDGEHGQETLISCLRRQGFALGNLGCITRQTIGGFVASGSDGGSLHTSFYDSIVSYRIMDGLGRLRDFSISEEDPCYFYACLVGAGLCGIILNITLQLEKSFWVKGQQIGSLLSTTVPKSEASGPLTPIDFFFDRSTKSSDAVSLSKWFQDPEHQYSRILYWPQPGLPPRVQIWSAKRTETIGSSQSYAETEPSASKGIINLLSWALWAIQSREELLSRLGTKTLSYFIPLKTSHFDDEWWKTLAMDDMIPDQVLPTSFLEMWFDLEDAPLAMRTLNHLHTKYPKSIGNFFTEIYPGKASKFWMSPSFGRDKVRLNVSLIQYQDSQGENTHEMDITTDTPDDFLRDYLTYFLKYGPRDMKTGRPSFSLHWGKWLGEGSNELLSSNPMYYDWLKIRNEMDPHKVFLDSYWHKMLSIQP